MAETSEAAPLQTAPVAAAQPANQQMVAAGASPPPARSGEVIAPARARRRLVLPLVLLAALGFGASRACDRRDALVLIENERQFFTSIVDDLF